MDDILIRAEDTEEGHAKVEAELGAVLPQPRNTKDYWQPPEAGWDKEGFFLSVWGENSPASILISAFLSVSRTAREYISVVLSHLVCGSMW